MKNNEVLYYRSNRNIILRKASKFIVCEVIDGLCYKELDVYPTLRYALMACKVQVA
jgi:hypothetical protein